MINPTDVKRGSTVNRLADRMLGIPIVALASFFSRRSERPATVESIGFLAAPALGDTFLTSAAIIDVRRAYPRVRLTFFATRGNYAAVKLLPAIDDIVLIDYRRPAFTLNVMRAQNLDILFDFTQWHRVTALYVALSGAKYRVGFRSLKQARHLLYDVTANHSAAAHEYENFSSLVAAAGVPVSAKPRLIPTNQSVGQPGPVQVVFHPWASGDRAYLREWSGDNWVELAKRLLPQTDRFKITGSQADVQRTDHLVDMLRDANIPAEALHGNDGLNGLCTELKQSSLVVSVNTGIMHLAAILGMPTIALNGPTSTLRWGPVGPLVDSVEPRGGGGGFLHFGYEFAGNPTDTMERIHVDDVYEAANRLMPDVKKRIKTA